MGKITYGFNASLDRFIEDAMGNFDWSSPMMTSTSTPPAGDLSVRFRHDVAPLRARLNHKRRLEMGRGIARPGCSAFREPERSVSRLGVDRAEMDCGE